MARGGERRSDLRRRHRGMAGEKLHPAQQEGDEAAARRTAQGSLRLDRVSRVGAVRICEIVLLLLLGRDSAHV